MKESSAQLDNCMDYAHKHPKVTKKVSCLRIHEQQNGIECAQLVSSMLPSKEDEITSATHVGRPSSTQVTCAPFSSSARQYTIFGSSWNFCMRNQA